MGLTQKMGDNMDLDNSENGKDGFITYYRRRARAGGDRQKRWKEMKWERLNVKKKASATPKITPKRTPVTVRRGEAQQPGRRWGHTCNAVMKNGRVLYYVFGGVVQEAQGFWHTNDVHIFDMAKKMWSKPRVKGTPPSPRDSHTCTTVGDRLFVFGGIDGGSPMKDLHILDIRLNRWISPITKGEGPSGVEGHSAALIGDRLFVFGGCGRSPDGEHDTISNELHILDTVTLTWTKAATLGTPPVPRDAHTCSSYRNNFIVLCGENLSYSSLADVYILDANTLAWKELSTTGQKLTPRGGHTTVALANYLFVFGGYNGDCMLFNADLHVLDVESGVWTKETTVGEAPSSRFACAGDCSDPEKGILFFGGCNENNDGIDDIFHLDTKNFSLVIRK